MKRILDPEHRAVLKHFARRDTLMAFDYDGTLAPIVADPLQAQMRPATRQYLKEVALRYPAVVITGRSRVDVKRFLSDIPLREVVGNHGFEAHAAAPAHIVRRVAEWRVQLDERLGTLAGVVVEDKRYSLAIHYRRCNDAEAVAAVRHAAMSLEGARLIGGKLVLNVVPAEAPNKGDALLRLCTRLASARAVFVGDDDTDEDVFTLSRPDTVLGIRVGETEESAAEYSLRGQSEIDALLVVLCAQASAIG
ncbi:MAG: trehalose-phosphatase [Chromatiales bacterium]